MNQINPEKLLLSKWTAQNVDKGEKHFLVRELRRDENARITGCQIEAIINGSLKEIDWRELKDHRRWTYGWH